jgi:hypothetical protein
MKICTFQSAALKQGRYFFAKEKKVWRKTAARYSRSGADGKTVCCVGLKQYFDRRTFFLLFAFCSLSFLFHFFTFLFILPTESAPSRVTRDRCYDFLNILAV